MEFRMLGPVELRVNGRRHDLGSRKERCMLAALLWEGGRPVSADELIRRVWGDGRPGKPRSSLYSDVSRLRATLRRASGDEREWLVRNAGSYTLNVSADEVDLFRFRRLRDEARIAAANGDDTRAFALLDEAERLWRGAPLAELDSMWAEGARFHLEEEHYNARLDRIDAGLRLGRYAGLVREAAELAAQRQFDEPPVEYLMRALFMSGRRAEAFQAYREFRNRYMDETGGEPSARLRDLQQQMLHDAPELTARSPRRPDPVHEPTRTVPRDNPDFTGRTVELDSLSGWLDGDLARSAVPVVVISGMAGVGKTALAVHAAHERVGRYPDQLYIDLRGHAPNEDPVAPGTALGTLLRALGIPDVAIPAETEDRAAMWRSRLAGRPTLVLLDDARDDAQVRPLLPGAPGCLVLITTRRRIDLPGTRWLSLDPMPPADAAALFARASGREQVDGPAAASVLRLCDYLPLEIQLAGSELRRHPAWEVGDLAMRLRENHTADRPVGAALALSCHYLTAEQRHLLRQVALHPGPGFSLHAAAAMAASRSLTQTSRTLDALVDNHLIEEPSSGRFAFHDLIREYAWDLALAEDTGDDRYRTMHRMADYYLWLVDSADQVVFPFRRRLSVVVTYVPGSPPPVRTPDDYRHWVEAEQAAILAVTRYVAAHGLAEQASLLASALAWFLDTGSYWADAVDLHQRAVSTWRSTGNTHGEARALTDLCRAFGRVGRYGEAADCAYRALSIARGEADRGGEAEVLDNLGLILWQTSRFAEALAHYDQALAAWRVLGDEYGEAEVLTHSATVLWHLNNYPDALRRTEQALVIYRSLGDSRGEAHALNSLGNFHQDADRHEQALDSYRQALDIHRDLGNRLGEAAVVDNIGNVCLSTGLAKDALVHYRTALDIYRDLGNRRSEADALNNLGAVYRRLGHYGDALDQHRKALVLAHDLSERFLEAQSHCGSGDTHLAVGNHSDAAASYRAALEISQHIGDRYQEAQALHGLGRALAQAEDAIAATEHLKNALAILTSIGKTRDADMVRDSLRELGHSAP